MQTCYSSYIAPAILAAVVLLPVPAFSAPHVGFALPERTRLLEDQRLDLVLELRQIPAPAEVRVTANGQDLTPRFRGPLPADLDCDGARDAVYRLDLMSFPAAGWVRLEAEVVSPAGRMRAVKDILVQPFRLPQKARNVIFYVGDAMTEAFRDAGRIVSRSVETAPGVPGLREGFYDRLLEMDQMPVSGMVIGHGADKIIPDSANTASALTTGNKTFDGAIATFGDGTDCAWLAGATSANLAYALDNPRVETLAEYLKRKHNYRVGIVTTASLADATSAANGAHVGERDAAFEVIGQFLENPMLGGAPVADVLMGGGRESFDPDVRADRRDMVAAFLARGYRLVGDAKELNSVSASDGKVLGLFRRATTVTTHASGIRPSSAGHMNVAYDKLGLTRPGSEPIPEFGQWTNQPFLDDMTRKAIEVLAGPDGKQPFYLLVEGASIDKQGHSGHAAGSIWDVIELDKAVGAGRAWARSRKTADTLMVVTADHGQSIAIVGVAECPDADYFDRTSNLTITVNSPAGSQTTRIYKDVHTNVRSTIPYGSLGSGKTGPPSESYVDIYGKEGFPDYIDADADGYPENRETGGKGKLRLSVGFRTGSHASVSLPLSAEGPGAFLFTGFMDQTEVPLKIAAALGSETSDGDMLLEKMLSNPAYPRTIGK